MAILLALAAALVQDEEPLRYRSVAARPDAELAAAIREILRRDGALDHRRIRLDVREGHVVLKGSVRTSDERARAALNAWIDGVRSVDVSGLQVRGGGSLREAAIRAALDGCPAAKFLAVGIEVRDGEVTLTGASPTILARRKAERCVAAVEGVRSVRNFIEVRPPLPVGDAVLRKMAGALLAQDPLLRDYMLAVRVEGGRAVLEGKVIFAQDRERAEEIAASLPGIVAIENRIELDPR